MLSKRNLPIPQTSETCEMLLEGVKSSVASIDPFRQQVAKKKLDLLRKHRCRKALLWIHENYKNDPLLFVQQFAKRAWDYAESV